MRDDANGFALAVVFLYQLNGPVASHRDRDDHVGKEHRVAEGQNRQLVGHLLVEADTLVFNGHDRDELAVGVYHI